MSDFLARKPSTPGVLLLFFTIWSGGITLMNVMVIRQGSFRWGRGVNAPIIRASEHPISFWFWTSVWQLAAVIAICVAAYRFWRARRDSKRA